LNALSTIAVRKTGTPIAAANAIIVRTRETMMESPSLQRRSEVSPADIFFGDVLARMTLLQVM
jgi:hypothetical protein